MWDVGHSLVFFIYLASLDKTFHHFYIFNKFRYDKVHHKAFFAILVTKSHQSPSSRYTSEDHILFTNPLISMECKNSSRPIGSHILGPLTTHPPRQGLVIAQDSRSYQYHLCVSPPWSGPRLAATPHTTAGTMLPLTDHGSGGGGGATASMKESH